MPWSIVKRGSSYSVVNDDTGEVKGSGMTEQEARQLQKALYANVHEDKKWGRRPKKKMTSPGRTGRRDALNVPWTYGQGGTGLE